MLTLAEIKPVPEVVATLANLLERAKKGELRSVCFSCTTTGNETAWGMVSGQDGEVSLPEVNWDLDRLKQQLQNMADEMSEDSVQSDG